MASIHRQMCLVGAEGSDRSGAVPERGGVILRRQACIQEAKTRFQLETQKQHYTPENLALASFGFGSFISTKLQEIREESHSL